MNREGVEIKITNPSRMAHTVATVPEEVSSMAKNSTDWATPENRKRESCRFSFLARMMPRMVPGMPVRAIIREMNWESTVKSGFRGKR